MTTGNSALGAGSLLMAEALSAEDLGDQRGFSGPDRPGGGQMICAHEAHSFGTTLPLLDTLVFQLDG